MLTLGQLRRLLDERECGYSDGTVVQATHAATPHYVRTFEIDYLSGTIDIDNNVIVNDIVTLHLVEVDD